MRLLRLAFRIAAVIVGAASWTSLTTWLTRAMGERGIHVVGPVAWLTVLLAAILLAYLSAWLIAIAIRKSRKPRRRNAAHEDWTDLTGD